MQRMAFDSIHRNVLSAVLIAAVACLGIMPRQAHADVTDEQVGQLIEKLKKDFYAMQRADGSFEPKGEGG